MGDRGVVVVMSAGHVGGTRGSGIVSSAADVLWMSVRRGMRGVGRVCEICMCLGLGGEEGGEWMGGLGLGFTNPEGTGGVSDVCLGCGGVGREWVGGLHQGLEGWCYVCVSLDFLCRWQVQVSVYCNCRIPAHLRCTLCSILLHLMDICFLTCICLWQISQIQTRLFNVVGLGLVSTSPDFVRSSASHPAGLHGRLAKNGKSDPISPNNFINDFFLLYFLFVI